MTAAAPGFSTILDRTYKRGKDGRFSSGGGPGSGKDLVSADGGKAVSAAAFGDPARASYDTSDRLMSSIAHQQGFDGPPKVVSRAEMDTLVANGHTEIFRGVGPGKGPDGAARSAAAIQEQLRSGAAHYGLGQYGNGIYTSTSRDNAEGIYSSGAPGSVARMALHPKAKTVEYGDLSREYQEHLKSGGRDNPDGHVISDMGRFAAAKGYDAIRVPETAAADGDSTYVVLNRTAVAVEEA